VRFAGSWAKNRIRAVQRTAGVTANDVVTAVVAGIVHQWLRDRGELPKQPLVAICPITLRSRERDPDNLHGNRFGLWLCPLGTNIDDPVARLDLIHRSMSEGKHWVAERGAAASLLTIAGSIAATVIFPMLPFHRRFAPDTTCGFRNVPGPRDQMYWNGVLVEEICPVSTVYDGQALNITTCSYADRVGIGYVAGAEVVPDIHTLMPLTEARLSELEAAVGAPSA
jgi:diacylglycerol O-acyltransferase